MGDLGLWLTYDGPFGEEPMADLTPSLAADRSKGPPGLVEVLEARRVVSRHLSRTSLYPYPGLSALVGAEVWVKHENHQPIDQARQVVLWSIPSPVPEWSLRVHA